ncbi:hypothetical protein FOC4_g10014167 [Fusarium odoratissimum]|uniref:Uncharacterized protein n=1 Tax=Fusarium oxysporum f. sp. cubense (strain race 4) TaxID=2502994 RepID=N1R7T6_FUSC4|nr:hypothetical protein FOC4_g10014167 [Fusarium odoratissimum]
MTCTHKPAVAIFGPTASVPHPSSYQQLIETRGDSMVKQGLLAELRTKAPEKTLLQGAPDSNRGVWKAIGYPEFYPYLDYDGTSDIKREGWSRLTIASGGSSSGNDPSHVEAAKELSLELHRNSIVLIYGCGTTRLMGAAASTLVEVSGPSSVHGIVPAALAKFEEKDTGQSHMSKFGSCTVMRDMHTRKRLMIEAVLNEGPESRFVALSGGYGTMEELLEIATWY